MNTTVSETLSVDPAWLADQLTRYTGVEWVVLEPESTLYMYSGTHAQLGVALKDEIYRVILSQNRSLAFGDQGQWQLSLDSGDTFHRTAKSLLELLADPALLPVLRGEPPLRDTRSWRQAARQPKKPWWNIFG